MAAAGKTPAFTGARELVLLEELAQTADCPRSGTINYPSPADAAYIIYTSGSTGRPKGVVVEHRNVVRLLFNDKLPFDFSPDEVWIQSHSYCFDFSVWEMYGSLLRGGRLVIPQREEVRDLDRYLQIVREEGVTILNQTPAAFYGFVEKAMQHDHDWGAQLRYVIFGGDRLEPAYLRAWADRFPAIPLINMYGITETTVHVTFHRLTPAELAGTGKSPVGRPIPETTVYVCDPDMNLLPVGVPGELYVGGSGVSRGYLNRPELNDQRFIDNPFSPGERLYRTGDLGRWSWSGGLEYLGRNDQQVQVRGFRVELGEIESRLLEHPGVKECVVLALEGEHESRSLAAWIVFEAEVTVTALREHLAQNLADYMIPAWFTPMSKLPLTANGKLDRKSLPDQRSGKLPGLDLGTSYLPPRNELEQTVAEVLQGVLARNQVGIHDNYFALGGDSIRAIQVVSRLQQQGLKVEMIDIFQFPTVAGLAGRVTKLRRIADQGCVNGIVPLTPVQLWFFAQHGSGPQHYNQSVLLRSSERLDEQLLNSLFSGLITHHDALRICFTLGDSGWQQENRGAVVFPGIETVDLTASPDPGKALELHAAGLQSKFDLAAAPLVSVVLYRLQDGDRLLMIIHHLVVDGVSWRILAEDLMSGYGELKGGKPLSFPAKSDSFKLWSERLTEYAASGTLLKEQEYWQTVARSDVARLPLLEAPRVGTAADFDEVQTGLSEAETMQLLIQANQAYRSDTADLLLTALARALHDWTGSRRHLITLEGHGREDIGTAVDISRTVGWFTSLFPHLLELADRDDPGYQLRVVKEGVRSVPNHGLGYGLLAWLTPDALKEGFELPQLPAISFNYLGTFDADFGSGTFSPTNEPHGATVGPQIEAPFALECTCSVMGGLLSINFRYDRRLITPETGGQLAVSMLENLRSLVSHCCQAEETIISPSDISYDGLDIDQLDSLLEGLSYDN
jgi:amino acid adenylation domain-containing protein/non-ribosomal peptide synthase protein (TIGR01720 family)